jgi:hypothetical protein
MSAVEEVIINFEELKLKMAEESKIFKIPLSLT